MDFAVDIRASNQRWDSWQHFPYSSREDTKKNELKLWRNQAWVIPPEQNARFVWKMEQVLDIYKRPYNPSNPVIGFDEGPKQLIGQKRQPVQLPDGTLRYDYEYMRNGVGNISGSKLKLVVHHGCRTFGRKKSSENI